MDIGTVPKILDKQNGQGYWEAPDRFYTAKYKGTVCQLIILAELGADQNDERIKKDCEFILENSQDHEGGGFSAWRSVKSDGGRYIGVIPCLTCNKHGLESNQTRILWRSKSRTHNKLDYYIPMMMAKLMCLRVGI